MKQWTAIIIVNRCKFQAVLLCRFHISRHDYLLNISLCYIPNKIEKKTKPPLFCLTIDLDKDAVRFAKPNSIKEIIDGGHT